MSDVRLFFFPGACSRVTMTALNEIGCNFEPVFIDCMNGEQNSAEYLATNPKGKVPALHWHGRTLTENPAIMLFLDSQNPGKILPATDDPLDRAAQFSDLCWCASMLHPMIRQILNPGRFTTGETDGIKEDGTAKLTKESRRIAQRVASGYWYGDDWSIVDAYLCWIYFVAQRGGFDLSDFPEITAYLTRAEAHPSYQKGLDLEAEHSSKTG